jgi:hypothetical protein
MNIKMKIITSAAALALMGVFLTALALSAPDEAEAPAYSTPPVLLDSPAPSVEPVANVPADGFWVTEFDGYAAVYHNTDRDTPLETTGIALRSLRTADQEMLREGVFFTDYMDVVLFLEDFGP